MVAGGLKNAEFAIYWLLSQGLVGGLPNVLDSQINERSREDCYAECHNPSCPRERFPKSLPIELTRRILDEETVIYLSDGRGKGHYFATLVGYRKICDSLQKKWRKRLKAKQKFKFSKQKFELSIF